MTSMDLKEYLRRVYLLEQSLFQQRSLAGQLGTKIRTAENFRGERLVGRASRSFNAEMAFYLMLVVAGISFLPVLAYTPFDFGEGILCSLAIGLVAAILYGIYGCVSESRANARIAQQNAQIQQKNTAMRANASARAVVLRQELQILNRSIQQTEQTLIRYYGKGIIFPKYRELVAVSSFYEYFASGRCSTLEGHEGAYNIFEMESRQDLILRKLDDIIARLDRIEQNQYMLYTAIQNSNRDTNRMLTELNRTAQNIESNSSITAYNSRITAQNTEFLKWIEFLRK